MPEVTEEVKESALHLENIRFLSVIPFSHTLQGVRNG
jgi:hypothetical protein